MIIININFFKIHKKTKKYTRYILFDKNNKHYRFNISNNNNEFEKQMTITKKLIIKDDISIIKKSGFFNDKPFKYFEIYFERKNEKN